MNEELLKQLTRIADALEAHQKWECNTWFQYIQITRREDIERHERDMNIALREESYRHADAFMSEFMEKHPDFAKMLMERGRA